MAVSTGVNICRVVPDGYEHYRVFDEIVDMLRQAISGLGYPVGISHNHLRPEALNIVIGAHLLDQETANSVSAPTVVYNFEQIDSQNGWTDERHLLALRRSIVWDYSERNLTAIRSLTGNARLAHVPVGYVPSFTRIADAAPQDIDVLFYGSMNERRRRVLDRIAGRGLKVHAAFGVYGAERDRLIARAKVVLNVHFYSVRVFEIVRVAYLLANRKAVVTECDASTEMPGDLKRHLRVAAYDDLASACEELVEDQPLRRRYEQAGFAAIASRPAANYLWVPLREAIAERAASS